MRMGAGLIGSRRLGLVAVGAAAVAAIWLLGPGSPLRGQPVTRGPAGKALTVAVVNIKQVSDTCQRTQDLRAALEKQRGEKVDAVRALREKVQRAREDLKVLVKGSPAWRQQNAKVLRMRIETEVLSKLTVTELKAQNLDYTAQIDAAVLKAIARHAKAHGIDLVLRVGETDTTAKTLEELYQRMALRSVLYSRPALDITEAIRREVDRAYEAEKRGE